MPRGVKKQRGKPGPKPGSKRGKPGPKPGSKRGPRKEKEVEKAEEVVATKKPVATDIETIKEAVIHMTDKQDTLVLGIAEAFISVGEKLKELVESQEANEEVKPKAKTKAVDAEEEETVETETEAEEPETEEAEEPAKSKKAKAKPEPEAEEEEKSEEGEGEIGLEDIDEDYLSERDKDELVEIASQLKIKGAEKLKDKDLRLAILAKIEVLKGEGAEETEETEEEESEEGVFKKGASVKAEYPVAPGDWYEATYVKALPKGRHQVEWADGDEENTIVTKVKKA